MYTLQDYFKEAKLKNPVDFASDIVMKWPPRKHQVSGLNKLLTNDYYGLYDEPGTGKTMQSQAFSLFWASEGQKTVVVMPPFLLYQYQEELFEVFKGCEKYVTAHILDQSPKKRKELYEEWDSKDSWPTLLHMSYQMFQREYKIIQKAKYKVGVFDEAHNLKNSESKIFEIVESWRNQRGGSSAVFMTGTPIHNELIDAYAMIKLTSPDEYFSFKVFDRMHCEYTKYKMKQPRFVSGNRTQSSFKQRTGYVKVPEIRKSMYKRARRVLKKDVLDIKDPTICEIPVKLETGHISLYKKLVRERLMEYKGELIMADNAQSLRMKCLQIVTCPELFTDKMNFKNNIIGTCQTVIDGMDINKSKVIIFANFQDSVRNLDSYFEKYNPALIYGDSNTQKNRLKFLNDDSCRVLIANPKSAGAGFNFQPVCHTVIFSEPTGVPGDFRQCIDRVLRSGQEYLVNVFIIKALATISPKATQEMLRKADQAQQVHKDWHTFVKDFQAGIKLT